MKGKTFFLQEEDSCISSLSWRFPEKRGVGREEEAGFTEDFETPCGSLLCVKDAEGVWRAQDLTPGQAGAGLRPQRLHRPWDPALGPRRLHADASGSFPSSRGCSAARRWTRLRGRRLGSAGRLPSRDTAPRGPSRGTWSASAERWCPSPRGSSSQPLRICRPPPRPDPLGAARLLPVPRPRPPPWSPLWLEFSLISSSVTAVWLLSPSFFLFPFSFLPSFPPYLLSANKY